MNRATLEDAKKMIYDIKSEISLMEELGHIPTIKGYTTSNQGRTVDKENIKRASLLIEAYEKELSRKVSEGKVFKSELPKIEQKIRSAAEAMALGDSKQAQKFITEANKYLMKATL
ncbi:MAG: hypothetical protein N3G74_00025 [Candidatus Micrarchaeota archaeon]|nr:hypothetical protein [Candidatus Micrarchaeota archaeon]